MVFGVRKTGYFFNCNKNMIYIRDITNNIIGIIDNNGEYVIKYRYDSYGKLKTKEKLKNSIIKLNIKYYHFIKGKDNAYAILKQHNAVKEYELIKGFNFKFYEFKKIVKIVNIGGECKGLIIL